MLNIKNILSIFLLTFFFQIGFAEAQYVNVCVINDYNCGTTNSGNNYSVQPANYAPQQSAQKYPELCAVLSRTFGIGEEGQDVKRLQIVLGQEGIGYLGATGYFGSATRNAVKVFQLRNGIRQTGAVGPVTLSRMQSLWCRSGRSYNGGYDRSDTIDYNTGSNGAIDVSIVPLSSSGTNIMIGWSSKNANICDINGVNVQPNGQQIYNVTTESTFTINCSGYNSGKVTKAIVVKPNQTISNLPTVNLSINPTSALVNTYATLYWTSANATSCILNNQYVQVSGSQQILVTNSQVAYQLTCSNSSGLSVSSTVYSYANANPNPNIASANITASNNNINSGTAVTLNWTSTNSSSCTVTGGATTYSGTNGSQVVYPTQTTTYTVSCVPNTSGPSVTNQVVVYVNGTTTGNITLISNSNRVVTIQTGTNNPTIMCAQVINSTLNWGDGNTQQITYCAGTQYTHTYASNGTYNITVTNNSSNQTIATLQVVVNGTNTGSVTSTVTANPTTITAGQATTLTWSSTNASYCNLSGASAQSILTNQSVIGSYTVYPTVTTTYTISCYNSSNQSTSANVTVTVNGTASVTASITANPINPAQGQPSTLTWTSTNANYCNISGGSTNLINQPTSGSYIVYVSIGTNYQITCYNNNGQNAAAYVYVTTSGSSSVVPTANIYTSSQNVYSGQNITLNWYSSNANSCSLYGNNNLIISNQSTSGSYLVAPTQSTNYQITCTNSTSGQSASGYIYVTVNGSSTNTQLSLISKASGYVVVSASNACSVNGRIDWGDGYSSAIYSGQCTSGNTFSHQYSSTNYTQSYLIRIIDSNNTVLNTLSTTAY